MTRSPETATISAIPDDEEQRLDRDERGGHEQAGRPAYGAVRVRRRTGAGRLAWGSRQQSLPRPPGPRAAPVASYRWRSLIRPPGEVDPCDQSDLVKGLPAPVSSATIVDVAGHRVTQTPTCAPKTRPPPPGPDPVGARRACVHQPDTCTFARKADRPTRGRSQHKIRSTSPWIGATALRASTRIQSVLPDRHTGPAILQIEEATGVPGRCEVREQCLVGPRGGQDGVWGGMSEDERRALKRRNARAKVRTA